MTTVSEARFLEAMPELMRKQNALLERLVIAAEVKLAGPKAMIGENTSVVMEIPDFDLAIRLTANDMGYSLSAYSTADMDFEEVAALEGRWK